MNSLITGVNGFVGSHLAEYLISRGEHVAGTIRSFRSDMRNLIEIGPGRLRLYDAFDLSDESSISRVLIDFKPDVVYGLAAQSFVPASWSAPRQTMETNVIGTLNLLEAVRRHAPGATVITAGTSEQYGLVDESDCPIDENCKMTPLSPYGVSKCSADLLTRQYAASYGMRAIVTRAFNHSGARRGHVFAESDWAHQVACAELAGGGEVVHGNLDAVRDYTHVHDIVRGYVLAAERGKPGGAYVLASGTGYKMGDVLGRLADMARAPITRRADPRRMRPSDVPRLVGNAGKAERELGWSPMRSIDDILVDLLAYWRSRVHPPMNTVQPVNTGQAGWRVG